MNDFLKTQNEWEFKAILHLVNIYLAVITGWGPVRRAGHRAPHACLSGGLLWEQEREKWSFAGIRCQPTASFICAAAYNLDMPMGVCLVCFRKKKLGFAALQSFQCRREPARGK